MLNTLPNASILRVVPTYDNEGCISAIVHYTTGESVTRPYQTDRRGRIEKCPFCGAPLYHAVAAGRRYCMNNECEPRVQTILLQQLDRLGLPPSYLGAMLINGWIGNALGPSARNLIMVAHRHPDGATREILLARLRALSFTDFLMLLHVPYSFIARLEDELAHCTSLQEVYEVLTYGTPENKVAPDAFYAGRLALTINAPYAMALLEYNRASQPVWTEGS